jgi:hypothetical protein
MTHAYDNPSLDGEQFLTAVMHDRSVALAILMDAAAKLLPIYQEPRPIQTITITGGLPELTPAELADIEARRCEVFDWRDRPEVDTVH